MLIRLEHTDADTVVALPELWVEEASGPLTVAVVDGLIAWAVCEPDSVSLCNDIQHSILRNILGIVTVLIMVVE